MNKIPVSIQAGTINTKPLVPMQNGSQSNIHLPPIPES